MLNLYNDWHQEASRSLNDSVLDSKWTDMTLENQSPVVLIIEYLAET